MKPPRSVPRAGSACAAVFAALVCLPLASAQSRALRPQPWVISNVRLSSEADAPRRTLVLRDGRIAELLAAEAPVPLGAHRIDGSDLIAYPALVDAYTTAGCEMPDAVVDQDRPVATDANLRIDMREANRKGIRPAFLAADVFDLSSKGEAYRKAGYGLICSAPSNELLAGQSALATTRDCARRDAIVDPGVYHHAAFRASGGGYPGTLMGYMAQLRQFFYDLERHHELEQRWASGRPGTRPPYDPNFDAAAALVGGGELLLCEAETARDIRRWLRLADELDLRIAIVGGREAGAVAELLAAHEVPVFLTLEWGDEVDDPDAKEEEKEEEKEAEQQPEEAEPDVEQPAAAAEPPAPEEGEESAEEPSWEYEEPIEILRERRRRWEERRDTALRLQEAGVAFVFCSGSRSSKDLMGDVRSLVEAGLSRETAMQALTARPARFLGVERRFGFVRTGQSASFGLWTDHPLNKGAQLAHLFVEGFEHEFEIKKSKGGDGVHAGDGALDGHWLFENTDDEDSPPVHAHLHLDEAGKISGSLELELPGGAGEASADAKGSLEGEQVVLSGAFEVQGFRIEVRYTGALDGDSIRGEVAVKLPGGEETSNFRATRLPDAWFGDDCCALPKEIR